MAEVKVLSEIAGTVWKVQVRPGEAIGADEEIIILESMKMEIPVVAPRDGTIKQVLVCEGESVAEGTTLAVLEV